MTTTRPIVPRVNGDSSVGVPDKHWGKSYIDEGHFEKLFADNTTRIVNTVADMKADSDLKAGDTVRTLGYYAVYDGCGETYSVVNSSEIPVDGDKIIQLNNGLYAKRITQSDLPDIFLGGFFTSDSDTQVQLYTSENGINFNKLTALNIYSRDVCIRYYNQCFYLVKGKNDGTTTFTLYKSKDLKTWESEDFIVIDRKGKAVWAPDLLIDDDGSAYVYFAYQWGTERVGVSKRDYPALDMYVSRCSNIENAEFEPAVLMNLPTFNDDVTVVRGNNIDAHVFRSGSVYYCIVKSDHQLSLQNDGGYLGINLHLLKSSNAMTNWTEITTFPLQWIKGIEGPSVVIKNDMVYIYADNHGENTLPYLNHGNPGGIWCWKARLSDLETGAYNIEPITTNQNNRHGFVIDITANYAKRILATFNPTFIKTDTRRSFFISIPLRNANGAGNAQNPCNITKFVPVQNVTYTVDAGFYTIDGIRNVNQATDFYIRMQAGNNIRIHIKNDAGDNKSLWIGDSRNLNGQVLHFHLKGNEISYVGDVSTLCKQLTYDKIGPAALLANFAVTKSGRSISLKVNVCSDSYPSDSALPANEFLISIYNSSLDGIGAKIKRLSGKGSIKVKLIKTDTGIYQLWGKSSTERLCLVINDIMTYETQANPFNNILSFPYVTADDFPAGTEVPIESLIEGTTAATATNVSNKIYYSSDSPSVGTTKLFVVKQAKKGDDNVPNNGVVIQTGSTLGWNGKLYIPDNGHDGVWLGGIADGKEVGWTRFVENRGTWDISISGNADKLDGVHLADVVTGTKAANGYAKLPNGLILQWGISDASGDRNITLPIAYPNACNNIIASGDGTMQENVVANVVSKTQIHIWTKYEATVNWLTIGY